MLVLYLPNLPAHIAHVLYRVFASRSMVLVSVIANWMGSAGFLDVEDALDRIRTYDNRM